MAIELEEIFNSRTASVSSSGFTETRTYHVKGEADPSEVLDQLKTGLGAAHPVYANTIVKSISVKPLEADELIEVTYEYGDPTQGGGGGSGRDENNETWKFDMTSQSQTINYVESDTPTNTGTYQTMVSSYPDEVANLQPKANTLSIGVTEGEPVGVDVYRPYGAISVNKLYDIGEINRDFRDTLYKAQNTLNENAWLDGEFGEKEVLFLGASISYDYAAQLASVDYSFLFGKTRDKIEILLRKPTAAGSSFTLPLANGTFFNVGPFEYIWLQYPKVKTAPKTLGTPADGTVFCHYPSRMYRSTLYLTSDFDVLGLVGPQ